MQQMALLFGYTKFLADMQGIFFPSDPSGGDGKREIIRGESRSD